MYNRFSDILRNVQSLSGSDVGEKLCDVFQVSDPPPYDENSSTRFPRLWRLFSSLRGFPHQPGEVPPKRSSITIATNDCAHIVLWLC